MVKGTLTLKIYRSLVAFLFTEFILYSSILFRMFIYYLNKILQAFLFTEFILYSSILFRMFIYYLNKILQEKNDTICRKR